MVDGMTFQLFFRLFFRLHGARPVWFIPSAWMLLRHLVAHAYGAGLPCTIINRRLTMSISINIPLLCYACGFGIKRGLSRGIESSYH